MKIELILKRNVSLNWRADNKVLDRGVIGFEIDTKKMKFGDGNTRWNDLYYLPFAKELSVLNTEGVPDGHILSHKSGYGLEWKASEGGDGSGDALVSNSLNQFAATTKAQLNSVIIDGNIMYTGDAPTSHIHTFASLSSRPNTISGYGITNVYTKTESDSTFIESSQLLTNVPEGALFTDTVYTLPFADNSSNWNTAFSWGNHSGLYSVSAHNHSFEELTSKPTDLSGFGIINAYTKTEADSAFAETNQVLTNVPAGALFTDTIYTHPTGDGNKHIPANGASNNGNVLTAGSSAGTYAWESPSASGDVATDSIFNNVGDLVVGSGSNTSIRLAIGQALQVLAINSGATALEWITLAGGGDALVANSLGQFAATTKLELNTIISDGTVMYIGDNPTAHTHPFAELLSKPTTIAGYGITNYDALWDTRLTLKSTSNLSEGSNLYYTETRVTANAAVILNTIKNTNVVQTNLSSISDTKVNFNTALSDGLFMFVGDVPSAHVHTFASLISKPTTIGGYGVTDFNSLGDIRWSPISHNHNAETIIVADHGTGTTDEVVNVCYGTSATPPAVSSVSEGSLYIQHAV